MERKPYYAYLVAGVDVDEPFAKDGASIMDLFEQGRLGQGRHDEARPYESFLQWLNGPPAKGLRWPWTRDDRPPGLRAFALERPDGPRDPWTVVVGTVVADMDLVTGATCESVPLAEAEAAMREVEAALASWGLTAEAALYAGFRAEGRD